ncbi:MAG: hypothetical protein FJ318_07585 [SAR202 cluster bacterium]|nr:hypothetical protein [SAR202 cluster bacterium]
MPRYMIEHTHQPAPRECIRTLNEFRIAGSHYLTRAERGCEDNDHRAWVIIEAESADEARLSMPPTVRHEARVVRLHHYTPDEIVKAVEELRRGEYRGHL